MVKRSDLKKSIYNAELVGTPEAETTGVDSIESIPSKRVLNKADIQKFFSTESSDNPVSAPSLSGPTQVAPNGTEIDITAVGSTSSDPDATGISYHFQVEAGSLTQNGNVATLSFSQNHQNTFQTLTAWATDGAGNQSPDSKLNIEVGDAKGPDFNLVIPSHSSGNFRYGVSEQLDINFNTQPSNSSVVSYLWEITFDGKTTWETGPFSNNRIKSPTITVNTGDTNSSGNNIFLRCQVTVDGVSLTKTSDELNAYSSSAPDETYSDPNTPIALTVETYNASWTANANELEVQETGDAPFSSGDTIFVDEAIDTVASVSGSNPQIVTVNNLDGSNGVNVTVADGTQSYSIPQQSLGITAASADVSMQLKRSQKRSVTPIASDQFELIDEKLEPFLSNDTIVAEGDSSVVTTVSNIFREDISPNSLNKVLVGSTANSWSYLKHFSGDLYLRIEGKKVKVIRLSEKGITEEGASYSLPSGSSSNGVDVGIVDSSHFFLYGLGYPKNNDAGEVWAVMAKVNSDLTLTIGNLQTETSQVIYDPNDGRFLSLEGGVLPGVGFFVGFQKENTVSTFEKSEIMLFLPDTQNLSFNVDRDYSSNKTFPFDTQFLDGFGKNTYTGDGTNFFSVDTNNPNELAIFQYNGSANDIRTSMITVTSDLDIEPHFVYRVGSNKYLLLSETGANTKLKAQLFEINTSNGSVSNKGTPVTLYANDVNLVRAGDVALTESGFVIEIQDKPRSAPDSVLRYFPISGLSIDSANTKDSDYYDFGFVGLKLETSPDRKTIWAWASKVSELYRIDGINNSRRTVITTADTLPNNTSKVESANYQIAVDLANNGLADATTSVAIIDVATLDVSASYSGESGSVADVRLTKQHTDALDDTISRSEVDFFV